MLVILVRPFGVLPKLDEDYSRKASSALNLMSTFLIADRAYIKVINTVDKKINNSLVRVEPQFIYIYNFTLIKLYFAQIKTNIGLTESRPK